MSRPELDTLGIDTDPTETREWLESLDAVVQHHGMERAHYLLTRLLRRSKIEDVALPALVQTPYINTIMLIKSTVFCRNKSFF